MGWGKLRAVTVNRYVVYMNVPVQHVVVTLRAGVAAVVEFVVNIFMEQSMILYNKRLAERRQCRHSCGGTTQNLKI